MGPKAKGGKGGKGAKGEKGGKKKAPVLIEGIDTTEMNNPQLQQYMMQIYEKLLKEREERSYFQLERDKLRTFWEITRTQLEEARMQLRNKEYALEVAEEHRQTDINEVNQKVKYLIYEQNMALSEAYVKEKDSLLLAEKEFNEQQLELLADKKDLKTQLKTQDELHQQENKDLRINHAEEKTEIRNNFEKRTEELVHKFDKKMSNMKQELETKQKLELNEVEERKNSHIMSLTQNHNESFNDIRNYYNNITLNNLSLITSLKDNLEDMKTKDAVKDKQLKEVLTENKSLNEEMAKEMASMKSLRHQLTNYRMETLKIAKMKREMNKAKISLDKLTWDYELLNLRFENNQNEKEKSDAERMQNTTDMQRDVGARICYLEEKIRAVKGQVERREAVINEFRSVLQTAQYMGDRSQSVKELSTILTTYDEVRTRRMTHRQSLFL